MNQQELKRLNKLLNQRYWGLFEEKLDQRPLGAFRNLCESLGISVVYRWGGGESDGQVFEDLVQAADPHPGAPGFRWLEMTKETAEKILVIGLP